MTKQEQIDQLQAEMLPRLKAVHASMPEEYYQTLSRDMAQITAERVKNSSKSDASEK